MKDILGRLTEAVWLFPSWSTLDEWWPLDDDGLSSLWRLSWWSAMGSLLSVVDVRSGKSLSCCDTDMVEHNCDASEHIHRRLNGSAKKVEWRE